ncbi:MAG: beta-lactamase family protein [Bacteroidales bacterium]|nr:beta-lactamase family protein [Bacteroidales bacterium]
MKKRILNLFLFAIAIILTSCAGNKLNENEWVKYAPASESGLSIDSLKSIDRFITEMTEAGKIPGAAVLIARNGKIVYHTALGYRDAEDSLPLDTNNIFRIASMTKPIVSAAIMQLYEQGKLNLNDPVSKYIPSFANPTVLETYNPDDTTWTSRPAEREITIHHLLTHTSGIGYGFSSRRLSAIYSKYNVPDLANPYDITIESVTERLGYLPLVFDPGTRYMYGLNIDVLGRIVEVASGLTLGEYIENNITAPLKMNDTRFFFNEDISGRLTTVYTVNPQTGRIVSSKEAGQSGVVDYPDKGAKKYFSGGSGLCSTPRDYFIFSQAIMNGGVYNDVRILKEETVALMQSNQLDSLQWSDYSTFGYGFSVDRRRNDDGTAGEITGLGWAGAFNTWFTINPADSIVAIIMSQVLFNPYEQELVSKFRNAVNSSVVK